MSHETLRHLRSGLLPTLRLEPEDGFPSTANEVRGTGQHAHHHGSIGIPPRFERDGSAIREIDKDLGPLAWRKA
jgi:hypothetical protein